MANNYQINLSASISQNGIRTVEQQIKGISQKYKLNLDINVNDKVAAQIAGIQKSMVALQQQAGAALSGNVDKTIQYANGQGKVFKLVTDTKVALGQTVQMTQVLNKETGAFETKVIRTTDAQKKQTAEIEKQIALARKQLEINIKNAQTQYGKYYTADMGQSLRSQFDTVTVDNYKNKIKELSLQEKQFRADASATRRAATLEMKESDNFMKTFMKDLGKMAIWGLAATAIYAPIRSLQEGIQYVRELDTALNELQKVSNSSAATLKEVTKQAYLLGNEVARTGAEAVSVTTDFVKMGYSIQQSLNLAKQAMILTNVGENIKDVGQASEALIATLKGFGLEASQTEHIVDALSAVSNKYAVNTADLVYGIKVLSATLAQSGTSFEQTLSMLTAATEVLQDAEKASYGINMISQRLRGLDEEGNNVADLIPKLQDEFESLAGVSILDKQTGQLRSTYDIIVDVAKVWPTLTYNQQQYLAELASGNRQVKVFNALMSNSKVLLDATDIGLNSIGSAAQKNAIFLESIDGKIQAFNNSMQKMWTETINSKTIKNIIDIGTEFMKLNGVVSILKGIFVGFVTFLITQIPKAIVALKSLIVEGITLNSILGGLPFIIGLVVTGISLLNSSMEVATSSTQQLIKENKELKDSYDSIVKSSNDSKDSSIGQIEAAKSLIDKLYELDSIVNKTASDKAYMKSIVDQLNSAMPTLNLQFSEETETLNETKQAVLDYAEVLKETYIVQAKAQIAAQAELDKQKRQLDAAKYPEEIVAAKQAIEESKKGLSSFGVAGAKLSPDSAISKAEKALEDLTQAQKENQDAIIADEAAIKDYNNEVAIMAELSNKAAKEPPPNNGLPKPEDIDEVNKEISNLIGNIDQLNSAYEQLADGQELSSSTMIELIQKYPIIADYIARTNDLTLDSGNIAKLAMEAERDAAISKAKILATTTAQNIANLSAEYRATMALLAASLAAGNVQDAMKYSTSLTATSAAIKDAAAQLKQLEAQIKALSNLSFKTSGGGGKATTKENDALKNRIELENLVMDALTERYQKELDLAKDAYEAKKAYLENEKEAVNKLKEAYDEAYDAEEKRNALEELYRKRNNLMLAGQQGSAAYVDVNKQIADMEKSLQKEAVDTRFDKEMNHIEILIDEADKAYEEIEKHYQDILDDTKSMWQEVNNIMSSGMVATMAFLKANLEQYLTASPTEQGELISEWQALFNQAGLVSTISATLKKGSKGNDVKTLQKALKALGFDPKGIDGIFGSNTLKALVAFQKKMGISQTGKLDAATKAKFKAKGYDQGGLADYTGFAVVHGTPTKPEAYLSPYDTKVIGDLMNKAQLPKVLNNLAQGKSAGNIDVKIVFDGARFDTPENARKVVQTFKDTLDEVFKSTNRQFGLQNNVITIRR